MDMSALVTEARRLHQLILTDTVEVEQQTGETEDDLGTRTEVWEAIYAGPGLVQASATKPQDTDSTGRPIVVLEYIGKVPVEVVLTPHTPYRVRVTASLDPANIGTYSGTLAETAESNSFAIIRRLHLARS